jgi:hypothetical protein
MQLDFVLRKWSVWPPVDGNQEKEKQTQKELLSCIPKMLKRRLSPLARIVFCAAIPCIPENNQFPSVFSSTHGELAKSFAMMELIEAGEEISPTAFSLSVHNAIAGLFSMVYKNNRETTVVAPGEEGLAAAFIEALGLLQEGEEEVLMVLYDEPLVPFYPSAPYQLSSDKSCAVALTISKSGEGIPLGLRCFSISGEDGEGEQPLQIPRLIRFLDQSQKKMTVKALGHSWCWEKKIETV